MLRQPMPSASSGDLHRVGRGAAGVAHAGAVPLDANSMVTPRIGSPSASTVALRRATAPCVAASGARVSSSEQAGGGRSGQSSILVADDNDAVVEALAMLLELAGFSVIKTYDGLQAVAAAERERPDIVLLDIAMPGLDGRAACRRIRGLPGGGRVRIIALSGWDPDSDGGQSADTGFDGHLVKPVASAELLRMLGCR